MPGTSTFGVSQGQPRQGQQDIFHEKEYLGHWALLVSEDFAVCRCVQVRPLMFQRYLLTELQTQGKSYHPKRLKPQTCQSSGSVTDGLQH